MAGTGATGDVLRAMSVEDVPAVMAVQEPASVARLSGVFPQASRLDGVTR